MRHNTQVYDRSDSIFTLVSMIIELIEDGARVQSLLKLILSPVGNSQEDTMAHGQ